MSPLSSSPGLLVSLSPSSRIPLPASRLASLPAGEGHQRLPAPTSARPKTVPIRSHVRLQARYVLPTTNPPPNATPNPSTASDEEKRHAAASTDGVTTDAYDNNNKAASVASAGAEPVCPPHTTDRKLTTRIDTHIIPFVAVLYLLAFLDRVNISNARAFGLEKDLGMEGGLQYNTALTIFFVPYVLCEIPSNIMVKRFSPRLWLSVCCVGFGLVTALQGVVQSYGGLLATRFFLGVFESAMFPACFYIIGAWYRRNEAQKRFSLFFSSTSLAGAFGGLLASAIGKMDYLRGYRGWRWIFIIEGCFTVGVGLVFLFTFPSFPEEAVCGSGFFFVHGVC